MNSREFFYKFGVSLYKIDMYYSEYAKKSEIKENEMLVDYSYIIPELNKIDNYVFRINADTPELRNAVEICLNQLRSKYPTFHFSAIYGG